MRGKTYRILLGVSRAIFTVGLLTSLCSSSSGYAQSGSQAQTPSPVPGGFLPFLHPQRLRFGRVDITVPSPDARIIFNTVEMNGSKMEWLQTRAGAKFAEAWRQEREQIASEERIVSELPHSSDQYGIVTTLRTDIKAFQDNPTMTVRVWRRYPSNGILQAVSEDNDPSKVKQAITEVEAALAHFHPEAPGTPGPGFQAAGGRFDWAPPSGESAEVAIRIPLRHDLEVVLEAVTEVMEIPQEDALLPRIDLAMQGVAGLQVLKHGPKIVAGLLGHEYVDVCSDPGSKDRFVFSAYFEFGGGADNVLQPQLRIRIDPTQISKKIQSAQLLALWEALLDSMQISP